jgi:chromosome segregation ATPase
VDDLLKSGSLTPSCRIYRDHHNGADEKEAAAARAEAEKAMAEVQADAERMMSELKNDAERAIAAKDAELAAMKQELDSMKLRAEQSEDRVQDLERKIASLTETKKREWEMEVVEPEIVAEEPPATVRDIFGSGGGRQTTLADLERQAQAELARMGAAGAKKFFGLKK